MSRIFINYRRQDSEGYVGRLYDHLRRHFEKEDIFMDVSNIDPGQDFVKELEDAIAVSDALLAVIGPQWLTVTDDDGNRRLDEWDDFVRIEIVSALEQNKLVVPVLVGRAKMPAPIDLPEEIEALARRNALELSHQDFADDVDKLVTALKKMIPAHPTFKRPANVKVRREKEEALKVIRDEILNATSSPLYHFRTENRYFPVMGEGNPDANILFIGESPGKTEAEQGKPFCGPSGDVLDAMLQSIEMNRNDVYMTNILFDRPPDNRTPTKEEIAFYEPLLDRMIDIIQPALIVTLGRFAMDYVLKKFDLPEKGGKISKLHGILIKTQIHYGEIHVVPLYHPAVVLYSAKQREVLQKDFEKLKLFV